MIEDFTQHIAILSVSLHIPAAQSLKQKRMVLKSLKDRTRSKFNVSIAELGGQEKWQRAIMGFAMIGNDNRYVNSCMENILSFIEKFDNLEVCDHQIEFF
jgi:uncharacterized protein